MLASAIRQLARAVAQLQGLYAADRSLFCFAGFARARKGAHGVARLSAMVLSTMPLIRSDDDEGAEGQGRGYPGVAVTG